MTVLDEVNTPYPDLPVYAFDETTYTGYHGTTDANQLAAVDGAGTDTAMSYNGLGQRLGMDAAGIATRYVMDTSTSLSAGGDHPLSADLAGDTTFYLYGLGPIAEQNGEWAYSLPDGTNTPRQLTDAQGEIILAVRYDPCPLWGCYHYGLTSECRERFLRSIVSRPSAHPTPMALASKSHGS